MVIYFQLQKAGKVIMLLLTCILFSICLFMFKSVLVVRYVPCIWRGWSACKQNRLRCSCDTYTNRWGLALNSFGINLWQKCTNLCFEVATVLIFKMSLYWFVWTQTEWIDFPVYTELQNCLSKLQIKQGFQKEILRNFIIVLVIMLQIGISCGTRFSTPPKRV